MTKLGLEPLIDPTAAVVHCQLGRYTEVGARTSLIEVELGDYSYVVNDSDAIYTRIGKFCSIAAHTRINPGDHPMGSVSQSHFTYRASAYFTGAKDDEAFFDWRRSRAVVIGHDVWIGHAHRGAGLVGLGSRTVTGGAARFPHPYAGSFCGEVRRIAARDFAPGMPAFANAR
jgi:acetyltransferase-like isoleucine patch superfamily enzyme